MECYVRNQFMSQHRPRVFISSTIYDFRDLRSALKVWLEELGYEVTSSEHNDFPVQSDLNSYENCLRAIDDAEYFILLVGGRVGGWYDAANRLSITQMEYRHAYERLMQGRLKLLTFVRQNIWDIREDRRELEQLLRSETLHNAEIDETNITRIVRHPSKFANDAEFIFAFIEEITRNQEMRAASSGSGPMPIGNWIRQFSSFRDIIDSLRVDFRVQNNLRRAALVANLKNEIEANLRVLLDQFRGDPGDGPQVTTKFSYATFARDSLSGGVDDASLIARRHLRWLGMFAVAGANTGKRLSTSALDEAITSGEMLEFDRQADSFVVGPVQQGLLDYKRNIDRLRHNEEMVDAASRTAMATAWCRLDGDAQERVSNLELIPILSIHDSQANVVRLSRAIHRAASGDSSALQGIELYGDSPIVGEEAQMRRERPTRQQIQNWIIQNG